MQRGPKEYVTLKYENSFVQHDDSNWLSKYERCTSTFTPPLKKADFLKVAINIEDMSVNGTDYTFAVPTGDFSLSFGQTADCAAEKSRKNCFRFSSAKINTRGTGMIFDPTIVFGKVGGWATGILDFQRSADGAEVSFRCAGWCGKCGPVEEMKFILTTEAVSEALSVICSVK
ncbi:A disintegrin and metalloproteinase with thrombospondin motifs 9-like isoform X2 [Saccostrea cucullata]|uniref:A disintegrin and metalloproteinase with thrombospondin motifs 9-like isoform X2 n=1 Tax=Saccostrea cuccullata TaxID=36930 RepID=UPI002ED39E4E